MSEKAQKDIISLATRTMHYCNLLAEQSENWVTLNDSSKLKSTANY